MIEDKLLIWRFKRGSTDALARIYRKFKDDMLRLAGGLLNDRCGAEDVVHDCFVVFAQSADRLKLNGNLKGYLTAMVANRARNVNKALAVRAADCLDGANAVESKLKRAEQWLIWDEDLRLVNDALGGLPYEQREVVTLYICGRMKFKAIAELQDVSINTVQSRYRYGLDRLRSLMNSEVIK